MKRKIQIIITALLVATTMQAQTPLTAARNSFRDGDRIVKQEIEYMSPGRVGSNVLWDMSEAAVVNEAYRVSYWDVPDCEGVTAGTEHLTSYYYRQQGDTLLLAGYENNLTRVGYTSGEPLLRYPFTLGDSIGGAFHGYAVDGETAYMRVFGHSASKADAEGTLILPGGDTLRHVLRLHTVRTVSEETCADVTTETALRLLTDSILPMTAAGVVARLTDGRPLMEEHSYRWYAPGYRYPVLETVAIGMRGGEPLYTTAYYYAPLEQEELVADTDNELLRGEGAVGLRQGRKGTPSKKGETGGIVDDLHFSYNISTPGADGKVRVEFFNSQTADIACGLYTLSGMVADEEEFASTGAGSHTVTLSLAGQQPGVYLLRLLVNGQTYTEKVAWK